MLRAAVLAIAIVVTATVRPAPAALCTAADVMACGASCWSCVGTTCTLAKTLTVLPPTAGAPCTFDFGTRDVVFKGGGLVGGANTFEVRARSLSLAGNATLSAAGKLVAPGGTITLTLGAGGLGVAGGANAIDVSGTPGGTLLVNADGNIAVAGPGITADGTTGTASAGNIFLTAGRRANNTVVASGNIAINGKLTASGPVGGLTTGGGFGGAVSLTAIGGPSSGNVDVEAPILVIGGPGGGSIDIEASGDATLGTTGSGNLLIADAMGDTGSGGTIQVAADGAIGGKNGVTGLVSASGSAAVIPSNGGGCGGMVAVEARGGAVTLGGGTGGLVVSGGPSGGAGAICVMTDTPGKDVTLGVPMNAATSGAAGIGGCITVSSNGAAVLNQSIDASGAGGGGNVSVSALTNIGLGAVPKGIHVDSAGGAGTVSFCANDDVTLGATPITATTPGGSTVPGSVIVAASGSIALNGPIDASSGADTAGGCIDAEAAKNLTVPSGVVLDADGGTSGGDGGLVFLLAGVPDLPGNLAVNGSVHAKGSATTPLGAAQIDLDGCTVQIGGSTLVDSSGDVGAANEITARTALSVAPTAHVNTTGGTGSTNMVTLPSGAVVPPAAPFSPAPVVVAKPLCTTVASIGCLIPCPTCGNSRIEFPETCDNGAANGPCQPCSATCRTFTCDDGNPCTTDVCDPIAGCLSTPIPGCTTSTTTTLPSTTTTSTTATTTTSSSTTTSTSTSTTLSTSTTTTVPATTTSSTTLAPPTSSTTTTSTTSTTSTSTTTATTTTTPTTVGLPTSTTTTSTSTSTTPTLPGGCSAGPTPGSIDCRLGVLGTRVAGSVPPGRLRRGLLGAVEGARAHVARGFGGGRSATKAFKDAAQQLRRFDTKLGGKAARALDPLLRQSLAAAADAVRADIQSLFGSPLRTHRPR